MIRSILGSCLRDFFYAPICCQCSRALESPVSPLCLSCELRLPYACRTFGQTHNLQARLAGRTRLAASGYFLEFRKGSSGAQLIHQIKYDTALNLAQYWAQVWSRSLTFEGIWQKSTLVSVPPNRWKSRLRGYHAACELADYLGEYLGLDVNHNLLNRKWITRSQTRLGRSDRWDNLQGVYRWSGAPIPDTPLILVDDVVTTGATVEACLKILQKQTAQPLGLLSLAYTV